MAQDTGATLRSLYLPAGGVRRAFTTKAADYTASRPDYPPALFRALRKTCPPGRGATVADVGAGTGILTRGLLQHGHQVVAVEPNAA
ncbi:MAG: SAM-dependent methyltransferase, partial [Opitutales bacterium]